MEFYGIRQIAPILRLDTRQVQRMAERGEIPARRVGGEWRFTHTEIIEWLVGKVGGASETELLELELTPGRFSDLIETEDLPISELVLPEAIRIPIRGRSSKSVVHEMIENAMNTNYLWDAELMEEAVLQREEMCPTAMENGVALLHPRRPMTEILGAPFIAFGRAFSGVPFASNGMWTDVFFLICSVNDTQHLRTLARLSRILRIPEFLPALREQEESQGVLKLIREFEGGLK